MKVIVCLKVMCVEQYEQLNVGGDKRVIEIYDKSDNILIKQATKKGYIDSAMVDKTQYRIRKLTPKECWRLMGFSDDAFEKAKKCRY